MANLDYKLESEGMCEKHSLVSEKSLWWFPSILAGLAFPFQCGACHQLVREYAPLLPENMSQACENYSNFT